MGPKPVEALTSITQPTDPEENELRQLHDPWKQPSQSNIYEWDKFREIPTQPWRGLNQTILAVCIWIWRAILQLAVLFCIIVTVLVTKSSLLLATSNVRNWNKLVCKTQTLASNVNGWHKCISVPQNYEDTSRLYCLGTPSNSNDVIKSTAHESLVWVWSLVLMIAVPHMLSACLQLAQCCFTKQTAPRRTAIAYYMLVDVTRVLGTTLLVFRVLPALDSAIVGLCIASSLHFLPVLADLLRPSQTVSGSIITRLAAIAQVTAVTIWSMHYSAAGSSGSALIVATASLFLISLSFWLEKTPQKMPVQADKAGNAIITLIRNVWSIALTLGLAAFMFEGLFANATSSSSSGVYAINHDVIIVALVNLSASMVLYFLYTLTCKLNLGRVFYASALLLSLPITSACLASVSATWNADPCSVSVISQHAFWSSHVASIRDLLVTGFGWLALPWWLAVCWTSRHVFQETNDSATKNPGGAAMPWFNIFPEASLITHCKRQRQHSQQDAAGYTKRDEEAGDSIVTSENDAIPRIYACVTMWHESEIEMITILKSLFRMDIDQRKLYDENSSDQYTFEGHIYFDDAMLEDPKGRYSRVANNFVATLVNCIRKAASSVYERKVWLVPPKRIPTPYGARLVWELPKGGRLVAHLKDSQLVRRGKRWSQVLYMYDILTQETRSQRPCEEEPYILALDGDVEFQPAAVHRLMEEMRRYPDVAAVCGRVHPVGKGPWVWYQQFEYAASHWIQKTTEQVLGSVLCSPGCFSLFRGSALRTDNVVRTFANLPTEPSHFLQYDQGEDRWLCTLLMQQGYTVHYSDEADVTTFAPETFDEFYNQRRRWNPAATVNNIDILLNWQPRGNGSINTIYMCFVIFQLVCTFLSTSSIFLLCIRALPMAVNDVITYDQSAFVNFCLIGLFVFVSYTCHAKTQVRVAVVLSVYYALVQALVLLGTAYHVLRGEFCSPETVFFVVMIAIVLISALLHPTELHTVLYSVVYFLIIPSTYILINIYTVANLHSVKWGTREATSTPKASQPKVEDIWTRLQRLVPLQLLRFFSQLKNGHVNTEYHHKWNSKRLAKHLMKSSDASDSCDSGIEDSPLKESSKAKDRPQHPCMDKSTLGVGAVSALSKSETTFFTQLIQRYLHPHSYNTDQQGKYASQIKRLRNTVSVAFLVANGLVSILAYSHQTTSASIVTHDICGHATLMDPFNMTFLVLFGFVMSLQVVCMLIHRVGTMERKASRLTSHLVSRRPPPPPDNEARKQWTENTVHYDVISENDFIARRGSKRMSQIWDDIDLSSIGHGHIARTP